VGLGDAVLVQSGGKSYLVDAGRSEEGANVVDFLRSRGVESLDGIVVSNPDADHIGGFLDVLDAYDVAAVYASGDPKGTRPTNAFLRGVREEGSEVIEYRAGLVMDCGTRADVIAPPPAHSSRRQRYSVGIL
jgi:beta-lactamase superfamily II metal-dependent hydrolase